MHIRSCYLLALTTAVLASSVLAATDLTVTDLRCDYARDPLGVDSPAPRLFWRLESATRGQRQTAYQVLVASSAALLAKDRGDLWDSGKVQSDETLQIGYGGKPLATGQQIFWKARAWDSNGKASKWSAPASWTMGILKETDWRATWIGGASNAPARQWLGYHANTSKVQDDVKWVQADLGQALPITTLRLLPLDHAGRKGFGFPIRFKVEISNDPQFKESTLIADHTGADYPNPGVEPVAFDLKGASARYVRVTATKLWKRDSAYCFALCQLEAMVNGRNAAQGATVTALDTIENYGWSLAGLTDGKCGEVLAPPNSGTLLLRREFLVKPGLKRALVNVCGLGSYELTFNGRKAGNDLFPPGWTKYDKTCLYDSYDITSLLRQGPNAVGLVLANGMYNVVGGRYTKFTGSFGPLKAIAQVRLEYADGTSDLVATDDNWRTAPGPITFSCVFGGEDYDARLEPAGWNQAGFDDSTWVAAQPAQGPGGQLRGLSCSGPPIRTFEVLTPVKTNELRAGVAVYDLGQNASLMPRLTVHGPAGSVVRVIPAELVAEDGTVDRGSCAHGRPAYWQYTLAGSGQETWFPKFYYHGSRYLQVELQAPTNGPLPAVESIEGIVVHAASDPVGEFECSNPLFNRIRKLVRWAQRSNMMSVLTDCPHREKLGWLEEDHLNGPALRYEFDLAQLFTKIMNDMADSQLANGLVPDIAPEYVQFSGGFRDSPEWGSAFLLVPWQQYEFNGDLQLLRRYYDPMQAYVAYLGSKAQNHIVSHGLGDWYDIGPKPPGVAQLTPIALTATAFYYYDAKILAQTAALLGKADDAKRYEALAAQIRAAFNREFFNPTNRQYATGSQCANAMALVMDLANDNDRAPVLDAIVRDVRERGNALTAGDVGYRYLLRALADGKRSEVIFDMNNQSDKPGYGYQLRQGATSLTEAWDSRRSSSQNHFMLGQINEWFYHDLAGIQSAPASPGFKQIVIQPALVGDVTWAKADFHSIRGLISSHWRRDGGKVSLEVKIPANATAVVYVPARPGAEVTEGGRPVGRSRDIKLLKQEAGWAVFQVGSGSYAFESQL